MPLHIVPDYIIYDELKRERERRSRDDRPQLEVPRYTPYWPDEAERRNSERDEHDPSQDQPSPQQDEQERGEAIISMW